MNSLIAGFVIGTLVMLGFGLRDIKTHQWITPTQDRHYVGYALLFLITVGAIVGMHIGF